MNTRIMDKKTVKAWAVVVYDGFISAMDDGRGTMGRAVFDDYKQAEDFIKVEGEGFQDQSPRIVPCTITYELPTQ